MTKMLNGVHSFINCLLLYLTSISLYIENTELYSEYDQIGKTPMDLKQLLTMGTEGSYAMALVDDKIKQWKKRKTT